ncbi:MAG: MurR/RpiR family transcriptional regulator, partial [Candidatus Faecousia sp.]|nr:MurR/RpiR family transcriptional regulator [Candidatus Faecousia sp.]
VSHKKQQSEDIFTALIHSYNTLTRSETKVADYILRHKQEIHLQSISELAQRCSVSEATISRFCHSVGCASFNEFKLAVVQAISASENMDMGTDLYSSILPDDSIEQKCRKLCNVSTDALHQTLSELDVDIIDKVVDMLSRAGSVYCFGQGNSSIVAEDAWGRFSCVSPKFHYIANANLQATTAELLGKNDVVLYFSFSGAVRELTEMGKILQNREAKLILVTRFPNSPGAQYADLLLICGANEAPQQQGSIAAKIGQLFIVDVLFHEYCARNRVASIFQEFADKDN